jgi:DNA-binding winged helix-turn-helix (wHTH) protein
MKTFAQFRLDAANQCLWRNDVRIVLAPKAFSVLRYLVEHAGRLVSQEEILEKLWNGVYVQPEVLRKYILEIRRVLEDPPKNSRFIATLPKRGYQFIAPVTELAERHISFDATGKLAGRERALEELTGYLDSALRGNRQIVFITGESGIGKTTLADAFQSACEDRPALSVCRGQCMEGFGGKEAYYPVLDALGQWIRGPGAAGVTEVLASQAPTWLVQFPGAVKPERREALQREILGATRDRMVREFCEAVEKLAAQRPLVVILEDLQWVDGSTLDLISALGRRRGTAKVMLLATYRPVEVILSGSPLRLLKQDLLVHRLCREITLERLSESEVEQYLAGKFPGSGLSKLLAPLIHRRSDGNPLFMVAVTDQLTEKGLIREENGRWLATSRMDRLDPDVPETLRQMLEAQVEQLTPLEQRVLRAASVAGQRFSAWAVSALVDDETGNVEEVCEGLVSRQQVLRRSGTQYEFRHTLYREALYRQLPATRCSLFHLQIAERMEGLLTDADLSLAAELASHFQAGHDYARAIRYLILTAANAARRYAHAESMQVLRQAMDLLPYLAADARAALEIQILERMSDALYAQGEMEQSGDVDRQVAELATRAGLKAAYVDALTRLARVLAFRDPDRCIAVCERALEVSRAHGDPLLEARAEMLAASWRIVGTGWRAEDARICEAARDRIRTLSNEVPAYYEILYAHAECVQGRYEDVCVTTEAAISSGLAADSLVVYLSAHSSRAHALLHLGRWGELLRVIAAAQSVVEKNGTAPWRGIFQALLAWLKFQACDFRGAATLADELLAIHVEEPAGQVRTMAMVTSGFAALASGAPERAVGVLSRACGRQLLPRFFLDWYWRMIGRLGLSHALLAVGRDAEAGIQAAAFFEAARSTADPALKAMAFHLDACIAVRGQDWDRAWASLNQAFSIMHLRPVPAVEWRLHATAYELHRRTGDGAAAAHHRARAAAILEDLVHSLPPEEPLRESFLSAPVVRAILGNSERNNGNAERGNAVQADALSTVAPI